MPRLKPLTQGHTWLFSTFTGHRSALGARARVVAAIAVDGVAAVGAVSAGAVPRALFTLPDLVLARFGACRFLLLAGYENLAAPLFALPQ
jgi:hypothetical protein